LKANSAICDSAKKDMGKKGHSVLANKIFRNEGGRSLVTFKICWSWEKWHRSLLESVSGYSNPVCLFSNAQPCAAQFREMYALMCRCVCVVWSWRTKLEVLNLMSRLILCAECGEISGQRRIH
jgi:hypothetical protein